MSAFVDEARFEVVSGSGGAGSASFRREKYVPRGGPDGGDGGKGGDIVFITRRNLSTLAHLRGKTVFKAQPGENGRRRRMHGKNGDDTIIYVPPGTRISDAVSGERLHDFASKAEGERWVGFKGGQGGLGNWHFKNSRSRSPKYAQDGRSGTSRSLALELALIADIGLIGLPSSGKSSLINAMTAANSKVGAYPFTTKVPHLGVLRRGDREAVIADIPGLIRGASEGVGLGFQFLRHIGRAKTLAYLTDLGEPNPAAAILSLETELYSYDLAMRSKKRIIIGTKTDLDEDGGKFSALKAAFPGDLVFSTSVYTRDGLDNLMDALTR